MRSKTLLPHWDFALYPPLSPFSASASAAAAAASLTTIFSAFCNVNKNIMFSGGNDGDGGMRISTDGNQSYRITYNTILPLPRNIPLFHLYLCCHWNTLDICGCHDEKYGLIKFDRKIRPESVVLLWPPPLGTHKRPAINSLFIHENSFRGFNGGKETLFAYFVL